jgi:formamidopyrimidine-DNA glycosylase
MPELPEVAAALRRIRPALRDRRIVRIELRHRAMAKALPPRARRALIGRRIIRLERRGKHQLFHLDDGATLLIHFRMTGDWQALRPTAPLPTHARVVIHCDDHSRVAFVDPRVLGTISYHAPGAPPTLDLGPEPLTRGFTPQVLAQAITTKRGPIKPTLLDQRVVAGLGNIYAAEACWLAAVDPTRTCASLTPDEIARLVHAIKHVLRHAPSQRYQDRADREVWAVYDREGRPCPRCATPIARLAQAGRSTYWCAGCQR